MKKYIILSLIAVIPYQVMAEGAMTSSEAESMVTQMKSILDQYANKIRVLEVENAILREEIRKAGIQIPLSAFSGITNTSTSSNQTTQNTTINSSPTITTTANTGSTATGISVSALDAIKKQHGERYAGFISRINLEWTGIKGAYKLPATAYIGGYEFVKQGSDNHAFVDIVYDPRNATAAYDAKILYEYNTGTYQRKLVGFFEFDRTTGYYKTRSGNNPFSGVARIFVADPLAVGAVLPSTVANTSTNTGSQSNSNVKIPTFAEIEQAYSDKRYLSVISLSNTYLTVNSATYDLLRIRYRTYFIIGKYTEALSEISKIELMGKMTTTVACDAQVIATYSKDTALITKYTTACKK